MTRDHRRELTLRSAASRIASDMLLSELRHSGWGISGFAHFMKSAFARSFHQAALRPAALLELSALHLMFAGLAAPHSKKRIVASFMLTATHLGMLGENHHLGLPNILTLLRANLPAFGRKIGAGIPLIALSTDLLDGRLARRRCSVTPFGTYADFLADAVVWTWLTMHKERRPWTGVAVAAAWLVPIAIISSLSITKGKVVEMPRSRWFRPAAAIEVVIGAHSVMSFYRARNRPLALDLQR